MNRTADAGSHYEMKMEHGVLRLRCFVCGWASPPIDMREEAAAAEKMEKFMAAHAHKEEKA